MFESAVTAVLAHRALADGSSWSKVISSLSAAEADHLIAPGTRRLMAARIKARIRQHPVDHAPGITAPDIVTDIILEAVSESGRGQPRDP
jgi:hypothetical protein